jgi:hypothetical protein
VTSVRPDLVLLWPSYTFFPLAGLAVLALGVSRPDGVMATIGVGLLALNALIVLNYAYFTDLRIEGDALVYRTLFGTHRESVAISSCSGSMRSATRVRTPESPRRISSRAAERRR